MNFLYPSFLFALSAISIPVVIHLFDLQRPKKVYFTNVKLLRNINDQNSSARRLKHLLILLCRILFISFLVLAFAQPFIKGKDQDLMIGAQKIGVYLDNSQSMQNEENQKSLLDASLQSIDKIITLFPPASQYLFLDNNFSAKDRLPMPAEKFKDRITEINYSNQYRQLDNVYKRQINMLSDLGNKTGKKIFWFSDFQKSTAGDLSKIDIDTNVHLYLVPTKHKKTSNVYIDSVWLDHYFIQENVNTQLKVKVRNSGDKDVKNLHIKLAIDNIQTGTASVEIAAGSFAVAELTFVVKDKLPKKCEISFEEKPIVFDNQFYFTIRVAPTIHILQLNTGKNSSIKDVYSNEEVFAWKESENGNLSLRDVNTANLIVINELSKLSLSDQSTIVKFVENGGTILCFQSDNPDVNMLNSFGRLMNLPTFEIVDKNNTYNKELSVLKFPDIRHPFFENVFEQTGQNIDMPFAIPLLKWAKGGKQILVNKAGQAFLSVFSYGKGNIYLSNTSLSESFTNIHKHSIFVPVMYKIAILSANENHQLAYGFNSKNISIPVKNASNEFKYKLAGEGFDYIPEQRINDGKLLFDIPNVTMQAGFFDIKASDSTIRTIAINPEKFESVMDFYSEEELKTMFKRYKNVTIFNGEDSDQFISEFKAKHIGIALWKYCIGLALLFLLLESIFIRVLK